MVDSLRPGMTHAEAAMPAGEICGEGTVPDGVSLPGYSQTRREQYLSAITGLLLRRSRPLWPQNVACLSYSAGNGGPLVAYRFDGEAILKPDKFVAVE